jgi:hypothetical protein
MKTILIAVLLAGGLITGACSRKQPVTAAEATPEPTIVIVQATPTPPPKSAAELEAERLQQAAARAEAERLLAGPTPGAQQPESSAPIITANDPEPSSLVPSTNLEQSDMIAGPVSGTAVEVVSVSGKIIAAELKTNGKGAFSVQLPGPGTYLVRYTTGPSKGKVIRTITAKEAGSVNLSVPPPPSAAP